MRPSVRRAARLCAVAAAVAAAAQLALPARAHAAPPAGKLTWYGQSCFLLETAAGTRILMDPIPKGIGYDLPPGFKADIVTISHEHSDHNNVGFVSGKPRVIRGLTADKKGWARVDEKLKDVSIRSVGVYHDDQRGAARGLDTVFIFEVGGVRIAHLGDLGHVLNDDQLAAIGAVDVLLVPVGGKVTIDGLKATRVVEQLRPRIMVIPMHYKTDASTIKELEPLALFLDGKSNVRRETAHTIALSPMKPRPAAEIVVLPYK
ncbi:MAG TPA: MBL fold metallo-hydrolase [Polyangia bacterium]|jgi:L-ascorbate metabolism protein UlaG (beta-lactamase superfamily)